MSQIESEQRWQTNYRLRGLLAISCVAALAAGCATSEQTTPQAAPVEILDVEPSAIPDKTTPSSSDEAVIPPASTTIAETSFVIGSFNILHAVSHRRDSRLVGACPPQQTDEDCTADRMERVAAIVDGRAPDMPKMDIFGTQETSAGQYHALKAALPYLAVYPETTGRMTHAKNGSGALWWDSREFELFDAGTAPGLSNTGHHIDVPYVGLQSRATGGRVYVRSDHLPRKTTAEAYAEGVDAITGWAAERDAPFLTVGDYNDKPDQRVVYCRMLASGMLTMALDQVRGNQSGPQNCDPPRTNSIDLIYGQTGTTNFSEWYRPEYRGVYRNASDHTPVAARVTVYNGLTQAVVQ